MPSVLNHSVACLLIFTLCLPPTTRADEVSGAGIPSAAPVLKNVELTPDGLLQIQVLDATGIPVAGADVTIRCGNTALQAKADRDGNLSAVVPGNGVCLFEIGDSRYACRVWRNGTAPPNAIPSIGLVDESVAVVLGNQCNNCNGCPPCQQSRKLERCYGLSILALGAAAAVMAFTRDNASE
ncbi:MAG: carboxypeptidase regulatory-like domain-containing protein [Planctomycetaceae bacterium]|nr:carboxypeptidase regulatory-like domain-containing protein [Planctomycetaceae bacterium]